MVITECFNPYFSTVIRAFPLVLMIKSSSTSLCLPAITIKPLIILRAETNFAAHNWCMIVQKSSQCIILQPDKLVLKLHTICFSHIHFINRWITKHRWKHGRLKRILLKFFSMSGVYVLCTVVLVRTDSLCTGSCNGLKCRRRRRKHWPVVDHHE